ncbi:enoyl-CoA hydratase-related protein [Amycolatopsis rhabdoformis]|uniref:Enoyl-CoA hydratase-related protein n=1 Tax=Amycolatopsis rhabdoformis TaxID=1448059 RepID=A0ABZ1IFP3_9PSEU|nr:enoyl-CoA hydratase-related protein [Amycolatopsis rhabdoformis]WSE32934.1 enoyl-CoA hydratase-related protein [Amycolatopsis rhabdoformis]
MTAAPPGAVRTEVVDGVLVATVDRPAGNAIDSRVSFELYTAWARLRDDPSVRAGVVTGAGHEYFSAGWDVAPGIGGLAGVADFFRVGKPMIAAVNGVARGGGFELALMTDLIVAAEHAEFVIPGGLGGPGELGSAVPARLSEEAVHELRRTGGTLTAATAAKFGVAHRIVPAGTELAVALDLARLLASTPGAAAAIKEIGLGAHRADGD